LSMPAASPTRRSSDLLPPTRRRPHHRRDQLTAVPFTVQWWWYHPPQPTRLPISLPLANRCRAVRVGGPKRNGDLMNFRRVDASQDRKSTRLNSSHVKI